VQGPSFSATCPRTVPPEDLGCQGTFGYAQGQFLPRFSELSDVLAPVGPYEEVDLVGRGRFRLFRRYPLESS